MADVLDPADQVLVEKPVEREREGGERGEIYKRRGRRGMGSEGGEDGKGKGGRREYEVMMQRASHRQRSSS